MGTEYFQNLRNCMIFYLIKNITLDIYGHLLFAHDCHRVGPRPNPIGTTVMFLFLSITRGQYYLFVD